MSELAIEETFTERGVTLSDFCAPIAEELKAFRKAFKAALKTDVYLVNLIARYMVARRGKMLRPILVILSGRLCGIPGPNTLAAAVLVELLHTATLMHDDVVDGAKTRRGLPSINSVWKNKVSVLMGDFLLSKALTNMTSLRNFEALELLSETAVRLSKGEILQMEKARTNGMDEEIYFRMVRDKTASLISAACELGALTTSGREDHRAALSDYGDNLGVAFQIKDDLFDFTGRARTIGKPTGGDVKQNLITLPLIHALRSSPRRSARAMVKSIRSRRKNAAAEEVMAFVEERGGIDYARQKIYEYSQRAADSLAVFDDGPIKDSLLDFLQYNIERKK